VKVFNHHVPLQLLILIALDAVLALLGFHFASLFLPADALGIVPSSGAERLLNSVVFGALIWSSQAAMGLYSGSQRYSLEAMLARTLVGIALAAVALSLADFFFEFAESRAEWMTALALTTVLLFGSRILSTRLLD